jgi:hypothetical protein
MVMSFRMHVMHVPGVDPARDATVQMLKTLSDVCIHEDPDRNGAMWNWAQVTECMSNSPELWQIQLNDDVVLLSGWEGSLKAALRFSPRMVLGLAWVGTTRGAKAVENQKAYAIGHYLPAGLAIAYHRNVTARLANFALHAAATDYPHDDVAASLFAKVSGYEPALTGRSIFGTLKTKSLMGHSQYETAKYTIEQPGARWTSGFVFDRHMAKRDDENELIIKMRKTGWMA